MDPATSTQTIQAIPYTAWQQAVFVVLFIVVVLVLLNWQSKQQEKWQAFIQERDRQWQEWMKETNCQTTDAMEHVTEALEKLTHKIDVTVVGKLDAHDSKVEDRINAAMAEIRSKGKV